MFLGVGLIALVSAVLIFRFGARVLNPGAFGLRQLPKNLMASGAIGADQLPAVIAATDRMARWRTRGAIIGALLCILVTLLPPAGISVRFLAVLAGALVGMAGAEWWRGGRDPDPIRSASLVQRGVVGVVGRAPVALLLGTLAVAAIAGLAWLALRPSASGLISRTGMSDGMAWGCAVSVPTTASLAASLIVPLIAIAGAVAAAVAITRRRADQNLPVAADDALRAAGVRTALGGAIAVAAGLAATLLHLLVEDVLTDCGPQHGVSAIAGLVGAVGYYLLLVLAIASVFRYILKPAQLPTTIVRQPVS